MPGPRISVVIPARNAAMTLGRTLKALDEQICEEPIEIIVVDDASQDGTAMVAEGFAPRVRLIQAKRRLGPGAARNLGVESAGGSILAFTDADCVPTPVWLARALDALEGADIVQGAVQPDPGAVRSPFDRTLLVEADGRYYQTANLLVKREVFDAVGGFRDWVLERPNRRRRFDRAHESRTRAPIGEDALFGWSARRAGARSTFAPQALVYHAVTPVGLWGELGDRWHWARDMPGLARLVPELRRTTFYRRCFFNFRTAWFDLAATGIVVAIITRRRLPVVLIVPYGRWLARSGRAWRRRERLRFLFGAPVADATTVLGLMVGSLTWRSVLL